MIESEKQYEELSKWVDLQFDAVILPDTELGRRLSASLLQIREYEDEHYPIPGLDATLCKS